MEIKVTFPDVPGAAIVGGEAAVMALIDKLIAGMNVEQVARMMLKAEYSENTGSLAGDPAWNMDAVVDTLEQRLHETFENLEAKKPPKALYIDNGKTRLYSNPT